VRPNSSEYTSPIVLVMKKTGDVRICADFREFNKKIIRDHYSLPIVEDQLDKLTRIKVFTTLDHKNRFFHLLKKRAASTYPS